MNDQRHVKRRIVDKKTMRLFAVLTEALTVISGECPFLFLPDGAWIHRAHAWCRKTFGQYPA